MKLSKTLFNLTHLISQKAVERCKVSKYSKLRPFNSLMPRFTKLEMKPLIHKNAKTYTFIIQRYSGFQYLKKYKRVVLALSCVCHNI